MSACPETERFAALLRSLKSRSGLSYEALARKSGLSGSSLHRYCRGTSVPQDYGSVHRLATVCGATPDELRTLHRLWALADAARTAADAPTLDRPDAPASAPALDGADTPAPAVDQPDAPASAPTLDGADPPAPSPDLPGTLPEVPDRVDAPSPSPSPAPDRPGALPKAPARADAPPSTPDRTGQPDAAPAPGPAGRLRRRRLRTSAVIVVIVAAVSVSAWALTNGRSPSGGGRGTGEDRPLFSAGCPPVIAMGEHDECVREVQRLLHAKGADIGVDGDFGPQTLRRVTAFQVLAGLQPNGVVGEPTKKALYTSDVRMSVWPAEKVRERVREVFPETPDKAVAIADCQSFLDPLHILPNTNGTRNWGLFQISDARLRDLGGTPREALDPEWNIQAARKLWSRDHDFGDWPHCERAADAPRSPAPRHSSTTARPPG
ncbi:helix-turn-helix domain-containing protein [Streptomyces tibetensis]|uniref:helix-turn-helix domain-containing protein n=1 Tax=Streptomyces tibetensis TaxID=2382123 RepID=UPI0033DFFF06